MPDKLISGGIRGMINKLGRMSFWVRSDQFMRQVWWIVELSSMNL